MKRSQPTREWSDARAKVERERVCRVCGTYRNVEAAHTAGRIHDRPKPCPACRGEGEMPLELEEITGWVFCPHCDGAGSTSPSTLWVNPDDIVPLCGPSTDTSTCHGKDHAHRLDLIRYLNVAEQLRVVQHLGGIALAYRHLTFDELAA